MGNLGKIQKIQKSGREKIKARKIDFSASMSGKNFIFSLFERFQLKKILKILKKFFFNISAQSGLVII